MTSPFTKRAMDVLWQRSPDSCYLENFRSSPWMLAITTKMYGTGTLTASVCLPRDKLSVLIHEHVDNTPAQYGLLFL